MASVIDRDEERTDATAEPMELATPAPEEAAPAADESATDETPAGGVLAAGAEVKAGEIAAETPPEAPAPPPQERPAEEAATEPQEEEPQEESAPARPAYEEVLAPAPVESETAAPDAVEDEEEEDWDEEEEYTGPVEPLELIEEVEEEEVIEKHWYIVKVASNRENTVCDALRRKVAMAGLDRYFGDIIVPTEERAEFKNSKRRVVKHKLYPGYIVVNMCINDETFFLVRDTPGIGDFTGAAGKPAPMLDHEIERILRKARPEEEGAEPVKTAIPFKVGDRVRIREGTFENYEGDVDSIDEANGRVTVMINIFGRSTPAEMEHWQIEAL